MIQEFYCKNCKQTFQINETDKYINYKCPICFTMSNQIGYIGLKLNIPNGTIKS